MRRGGLPAFAGGIPVVVLLLLLAGFGIGWGWGYVVTADEVPDSSVDGPTADLDEVPEIRNDPFAGDCETTVEDRRECTLSLRGHERGAEAARFVDRHGVRRPFLNTYGGAEEGFHAEHDGSYYGVTCSPHGD